MSDKVLYDLDGHVATITYNRPEALNAIDGAVLLAGRAPECLAARPRR